MLPIEQHELARLSKELSIYDSVDLAAKVAALQLASENADRMQRLYAVAGMVAAMPEVRGRPSVSAGKLRKVLNQSPLAGSGFALAEDPFNNPLTEAITFYHGSYLTLPDYDGDSAFVFRRLVEAAFLFDDRFSVPGFAAAARRLCISALALGDEVSRRARLGRVVGYEAEPRQPFLVASSTEQLGQFRELGEQLGLPTDHLHLSALEEMREHTSPAGDVIVPASNRLRVLANAVTFSEKELSAVLAEVGGALADLETLMVDQGKVMFSPARVDRNPLFIRPILRSGDKFVVALPRVLLSATCNAIIRKALEYGVEEELSERFRDTVAFSVESSLGLIGCDPLPARLPPLNDPSLSEAVFSLDNDKVVYALLITEGLGGYDPETGRGRGWRGQDVTTRIRSRLREAERAILGLAEPPDDVLHLIVLQGVEPITTLLGVKLPKTGCRRRLLLDASDLETVAVLEAGDQLVLWKFAGERLRFSQSAEIMRPSSALDEFYAYRRQGYGYDFFDDGVPARHDRVALMIPMGGAGALKREVQRKRDLHGASGTQRGATVEVASFYDDHTIPIYAPWRRGQPGPRVEILLEALPVDLWILGSDESPSPKSRNLTVQFADFVAYWLWQMAPGLEKPLSGVADRMRRIIVRLDLSTEHGWFDDDAGGTDVSEYAECEVAEDGSLILRLRPESKYLFARANNSGEREVVGKLLRGLGTLTERLSETSASLDDPRISALLDRYAPLGQKKKLVFLGGEHNLLLLDEGLPSYRKVQDADRNELRDELAEFVASELHLTRGQVPEDRRIEVLKKVVKFFSDKLERMVAGLSPEGLLEVLVAYNERLLNEHAQRGLSIPTWTECFGSDAEMVERMREEMPELNDASIASRFLIEYVSARPPQGMKPISLAIYDRLLATASEIANWGFTSDAIRHGIEDLRLVVLGSGRMEARDDASRQGRDDFMEVHLAGEIFRSRQGFHVHWRDASEVEQSEYQEQMEEATKTEFGLSLGELTDFLLEATRLGRDAGGVVNALPTERFVDELGERLGWQRSHAERAVEFFAARPRGHFVPPPEPFEAADTYPWRFNRALSYLRRPLLVRERGETQEIVWGDKNCLRAALYLIELCMEGRLKAKTKRMRDLISIMARERSKDFNDSVVALFEQREELIVRTRVDKVGKMRLRRGSGDPLGDIDVLVADPKRREVLSIETKDLAFARSPAELGHELEDTFGTGGRKPSAVEKHLERTAWLKEHLEVVLGWLGLDNRATRAWRVEPLIVVDHELRSPYMTGCPIMVLSFLQLQQIYGDPARV